jgi:hypothetical protein
MLRRYSLSLSALLLVFGFFSLPVSLWAKDLVVRSSGQLQVTSSGDGDVVVRLGGSSGHGALVYDFGSAPLNFSAYRDFAFEVNNAQAGELDLQISVISDLEQTWQGSAEGRFLVQPSARATARVFMPRAPLAPDHPFRQLLGNLYGFPKGFQRHWRVVAADEIRQVRIQIRWTGSEPGSLVSFSHPFGMGEFSTDPSVMEAFPLPLVDAFGQLRHETWDGKIYDAQELVQDGQRDLTWSPTVSRPEEFNQFGGWAAGPQLEATGFFRVEKVNDRWSFVDPDGRLFWSLGVTGVGGGSFTQVEGREAVFPPTDEARIRFYFENLERKFESEDWLAKHVNLSLSRLIDWGLNTIGAWSMRETFAEQRVPFTLQIHTFKEGIGSIGKLPDPFANGFRQNLESQLSALSELYANNSWLVGVFIHNELAWPGGIRLAEEILNTGARVPARQASLDLLQRTHGSIEVLNEAWGTQFAGFHEIRSLSGNSAEGAAYLRDMEAIQTFFADTYFAFCREMMDKYFPNHLYLGGRFHNNHAYLTEAASRHVDVMSVNVYRYGVRNFSTSQTVERPYLIGEFHFGVIDRGIWGAGLTMASDFSNQADATRAYLRDAINHPQIIGAHWFQWSDQPVTGRPDGENFGIGLVDIVDRVNESLTSTMRDISLKMYQVRFPTND